GRAARLPLGRDADQVAGDFQQPLLQSRLARLPCPAAEPVERSLGRIRAVARQELDVLDRQVELVVAGVADFEAVMRRACRLDRLQADETAYAVVGMYDDVAGGKPRNFRNEVGRTPAPCAPDQAVAEYVLFGDDRELARLEAGLQRQHREPDLLAAKLLGFRQRVHSLGTAQVMLAQDLRQPVERALAPAGDDHALGAAQGTDMLDRLVEHVDVRVGALRREIPTGMRT